MSLRIHIFLPTLSHSLGQREGAGDCPFSVPNTCDATVDILALSFIIVRTSLRVGKEKVFGSSDLGRCGWGKMVRILNLEKSNFSSAYSMSSSAFT